jgi:hypothetical protein
MTMIFERLPEFDKDFKRLEKKWRTLPNDLELAQKVITRLYEDTEGFDRQEARDNFFCGQRATVLKTSANYEAVKMRLDVMALGNKNAVRLVFIYVYDGKTCSLVELFSKTDKPREDTTRLETAIAQLPQSADKNEQAPGSDTMPADSGKR